MKPNGDLTQVPPDFQTALSALRRAQGRPEVRLAEIPAPVRLAPFAAALSADVRARPHRRPQGPRLVGALERPQVPEAPALATGRFVLLYHPDGSAAWNGNFRIVTYMRAQLEPDMGNDAMLGSVAWTWLVEALEDHGARYSDAGGTATRVLSESFGSLDGREDDIDIELRASWTPREADVRAHLEAWGDMLCAFAGLPPLPAEVAHLPGLPRS
ncbi:hypothetical protein NCCP1664_20020 [Zafaria cholistanensis]|uniref:DUF3000 domain-containing protein n=1 Tax=Zafaria cholistanensis TaxID=1682741 RepID=A0A5A7NUH2_9MICC|nr:DUF3000 domain-containing protein [Zafaria cholistanensis]GER23507.1 hypothetical protein NCCP1664_20020 [Zafaria cholistanensis]